MFLSDGLVHFGVSTLVFSKCRFGDVAALCVHHTLPVRQKKTKEAANLGGTHLWFGLRLITKRGPSKTSMAKPSIFLLAWSDHIAVRIEVCHLGNAEDLVVRG